MWLQIKTGYSFKQVYGPLDKIAEKCARFADFGGIADLGNTFAHIPWQKACKKAGIKPIYGVQLPVVDTLQKKVRRYPYNWTTFIAKTTEGLQEIYKLVDLSFQQFYYRQRITYDQVNSLGNGVIVLSGLAPRKDLLNRSFFKELSPCTPFCNRKGLGVACVDNFYVDAEDEIIYEPFADDRLRERKTSPIHIITYDEWLSIYKGDTVPLDLMKNIADKCTAELPIAPMVKYTGKEDMHKMCITGAKKKGIDLSDPVYKERYCHEINLINEKDYGDYFLVVADVIRYAKSKMAVGPSRGSSAGSLVCYLMDITEVDPLKWGLYFERFIDVNRTDLPDIDIDFQDNKRHLVIKYLERKYGKENVAQIGNINRLKPKSAIAKIAQAIGVHVEDTIELKNSIVERPGGHERANRCIEDTFNDTDIGQKFIETHPNMLPVQEVEGHPSHTGVHAAGVLVCNDPITKYCGVNSRENRVAMLDKRDAEEVNLLKIDALGLRTLSIIADTCDQIGKPYEWMYSLPIDDVEAYKIFQDCRFTGIFQFEGEAIRKLASQSVIETLEDISALTALGRPGPLSSGGALRFVYVRSGERELEYLSEHPAIIEATKNTFGVLVYQEQIMQICKTYGGFDVTDLNAIRKAISKTYGDDYLDKFRIPFVENAVKLGDTEEVANLVWEEMKGFGMYAFNKSHAVSYGLISYICAYLKAHYPLEFLVANLNNSKNEKSALKILRDSVENDGVEYKYFSPKHSEVNWCVKDGILYGGFVSLKGIGETKAKQAVKFREENKRPPTGLLNTIKKAESTFKYLYPARELYGDFYTDPESHGLNGSVSEIASVQQIDGEFTIIGCLIKKTVRDLNEACYVNKRDGQHATGQTTWLNIIIEDDTGQIMCKIKPQDYLRLGQRIAEHGKEDKSWYMVYGEKINGWGLMFVKNIVAITR